MKRSSGSTKSLVGLAIALIVLFVGFSLKMPQFATLLNVQTLARQSTIVTIAALGMTFVIVAGGIDLSIGSIVALVTVVVAAFLQAGVDPVLAGGIGVLAGAACGAVNGGMISGLKVGPFIVTLGSLLVIRGIAKGLAHEQKIDAPASWLAELVAVLPPDRKWMLLPPGVWLAILLAIGSSMVLWRTVFGRNVFAIGSNERAAYYCGLPVAKVKFVVYVLGGLFAGIAGLMQFSRLTVGDPTVAVGLELDVIAAVVIGGASLSGGHGSIAGSVLGALIMTTIRAGCSQMGLPNWVQEIVTGVIIVLSVGLDRLRAAREA